MVALLLQNIEGFPSTSMERYARTLHQSMKELESETGWTSQMPLVEPPRWPIGQKANASRWGRFIRYPLELRRQLRSLSPDVVHVLDHSHANLLRWIPPSKSIVTVHDVIPLLAAAGELNFRRGWFVDQTFRHKLKLIAKCARIITVSEATKRQLLRFTKVDARRIVVVPQGVEPTFSPRGHSDQRTERSALLDKLSVHDDRRILLHVCTRNRYKNTPALLRALARLPADVTLLRVGADLFDDEQALCDRLGLSQRVVNVGRVATDEELAVFYRAADVFVFPSTFEGFGWPPLEAMACGTPVVTSNAGSLPEVVGNAGVMVDPHNDAALAEAILRLLQDPAEHARRRELGLRQAAKFSWRICAEKTLAVYDDVVRESCADN